MTSENRALINEAAELNSTSLSDYVMSVVVRAARSDVLHARALQLKPDAWVEAIDDTATEFYAHAGLRRSAIRQDLRYPPLRKGFTSQV